MEPKVTVDVIDLGMGQHDRVTEGVELAFEKGCLLYEGIPIDTGMSDFDQLETKLFWGTPLLVIFPEAFAVFKHLLFGLSKAEIAGVRMKDGLVTHALVGNLDDEVQLDTPLLTGADLRGSIHVVYRLPGSPKYTAHMAKIGKTLNNKGLVYAPDGQTRIVDVLPIVEPYTGVFRIMFGNELASWSPSLSDSDNVALKMMDPGTRFAVMRMVISESGNTEEFRFFNDLGPPQESFRYGGHICHCDNFWPIVNDSKRRVGETGPVFNIEIPKTR